MCAVRGRSGLCKVAIGGGSCSSSQRMASVKASSSCRLPLRCGVAGPIVGAQPPVRRSHGLRVIGVAGQITKAVEHAGGIAPRFAGLIAVVLIHRIELAVQAKGRKGQRVGGEIFDGGVVIGSGLIAQPGWLHLCCGLISTPAFTIRLPRTQLSCSCAM